jgi:hypothetical protein
VFNAIWFRIQASLRISQAFGSIQMAKRCDRHCRGQRWPACATVCRRLPPIARIEFSLCYFTLLLPAVNAELMFQAATNANAKNVGPMVLEIPPAD